MNVNRYYPEDHPLLHPFLVGACFTSGVMLSAILGLSAVVFLLNHGRLL